MATDHLAGAVLAQGFQGRDDPEQGSAGLPNRARGGEAYEALLAQYGGCHYEEREFSTPGGRTEVKKVLIEADNKAVPPDKNVPRVDEDTKAAEAFGTW